MTSSFRVGMGRLPLMCVSPGRYGLSGVEVLVVLATQRTFAGASVRVDGHRAWTSGPERLTAPLALPQQALGHREGGAPTGRADPLVVPGLAIGDLVAEAQLALDLDQVLHVHARGERVAAASAMRLLLR